MGKRSLAFLVAAALLIMGGVIFAPGLSASDTIKSKGGVVVFRVPDFTTPGGAAAGNQGDLIKGAKFELKRTADGVSMKLKTRELPMGAYSIWWVIDNDDDLGTGIIDPAPPDGTNVGVEGIEILRRATGGFVGKNGKGNFKATLPAGFVPPANGATVMVNVAGPGGFDPMAARIGLVIRSHGMVISGAVDEQTNLFAGGCRNTPISGLPGAFAGGNVCVDPQITEFHSP